MEVCGPEICSTDFLRKQWSALPWPADKFRVIKSSRINCSTWGSLGQTLATWKPTPSKWLSSGLSPKSEDSREYCQRWFLPSQESRSLCRFLSVPSDERKPTSLRVYGCFLNFFVWEVCGTLAWCSPPHRLHPEDLRFPPCDWDSVQIKTLSWRSLSHICPYMSHHVLPAICSTPHWHQHLPGWVLVLKGRFCFWALFFFISFISQICLNPGFFSL